MSYRLLVSGTNPTTVDSIALVTLDEAGLPIGRHSFSGEEYPGYLAIDGRFVCAAAREDVPGETDGQGQPQKRPVIACFTLDADALTPLMRRSFAGLNICHVSINPQYGLVGGACYTSGDATVWGYDASGLTKELFHKNYNTPTLVSHAHCMLPSPDGRQFYLADLGRDCVEILDCAPDGVREAGTLRLHQGDGPRQLLFHPTKPVVYLITEYSNVVYTILRDAQTGALQVCQRLSTLPDDFREESFGASLALDAANGYLYASNRGMNSIAVYRVNDRGLLEAPHGYVSCGGVWPRHIALTGDAKFLLSCNERSCEMAVLPIGEQGIPGEAVSRIPLRGASFAQEL